MSIFFRCPLVHLPLVQIFYKVHTHTHTHASYYTPSYTHVNSYVVQRVQPHATCIHNSIRVLTMSSHYNLYPRVLNFTSCIVLSRRNYTHHEFRVICNSDDQYTRVRIYIHGHPSHVIELQIFNNIKILCI